MFKNQTPKIKSWIWRILTPLSPINDAWQKSNKRYYPLMTSMVNLNLITKSHHFYQYESIQFIKTGWRVFWKSLYFSSVWIVAAETVNPKAENEFKEKKKKNRQKMTTSLPLHSLQVLRGELHLDAQSQRLSKASPWTGTSVKRSTTV